MGNRPLAREWLQIAWHDLRSAQILYEADHYTDSIACDLQQALEKTIKAVIAFENRRVPRTHDLLTCYLEVEKIFPLNDEELDILTRASGYFSEERYPNPNYTLPSRAEIETVLSFSLDFFDRVLQTLAIEKHEL